MMNEQPLRTDLKFRISLRDSINTKRFMRDREHGPQVSFVYVNIGQLILLEGLYTLNRRTINIEHNTKPIALRYTEKEWETFIQGVKDGEFDDFTSSSAQRHVPIRDSKDPDGPILVFTPLQIAAFFAAIKHGKYDLTASTNG